jgi:ABC-type phosphate transport system substrate-binding protein
VTRWPRQQVCTAALMPAVLWAWVTVSLGTLNLTTTLIAKIYMGQILTWDDPQLVAYNPGLLM